jgi:hypothetical protein
MIKQTLAEKMRELSKYKRYRYCANQIKKAALNGQTETTVINSNIDAQAIQKLEAEGFTLNKFDNGCYKAYKINW